MSILEVTDLSMSYADKQLYDQASFVLNKEDHMGVIGQNGAGKSTLIRLITGQTLPDAGQIKWQRGKKIGYLDQYAESGIFQEQLEAADFYGLDVKIDQVMTGLGIDVLGKERQVSSCSGGQRSKIILAKLLLEEPDVLLLDEPTNYLDTEHIEWLIGYLNEFSGCFMVISHDYDFLEAITNTIIDVAFGKITKYTGSFQAAIKQKEVKKEVQLKAYEKQRRQIEKDEAYIRKNKAGTRAAMAKSRQKRLDKLERLTPPSDNLQAHFNFPYLELLSSATLRVKKLSVGYNKPLLEPVTFSMSHGEKVVLKGFNGVGKSTLIKSILGKIKTFGGTAQFVDAAVINYFTQELTWQDPNQTPLQVLQDAYPKLEPKTIRQRLARAGINAANTLSGGEQTKVKLCLLELKPSNFLILDEPTNHLDDETKQALKQALMNFPGNVLLVTHEASFYAGWVDKIFDVENIQLKR